MKNLKQIRSAALAEEHGAGEFGTAELTNKYKNATPGQEMTETSGHESVLAGKASAAATRNPSKENHLKAVAAHKNAQGFFKGRAHDYHLDMAVKHAEKAATFKEENLDEAHKLGDKVKIVGGPKDVQGKMGRIGEIKHGSHKTAPKTYTVDHDAGSIQLGKEHIRAVNEEVNEGNFKVTFAHEHPEGEKKHEYVVKAKHQNDADRKAIAMHQKAHPNGKFTMWDSQPMHEEVDEACWSDYKQVGMKMKGGRKVPNCVPKEGTEEDMAKHHDAAQAAKAAGDNDAFHKHMDAKYEVAKKRDAENAKKPVVKIGEDLKDACWKGYEAIGMKNKNGKQVPNCVPKESVDIPSGTDLNEASGYKQHSGTAAMHSQAAKDNPSIATHVKAANSHEKASNSHSRKLDKLIRNKASAADLAPHETMVKQHDKQVVMHKFMAHRLIKKHMNEAVEIAEDIDLKKNEKITQHSKAAVIAANRGDKQAQQFHLAIIAKLKNESVEVTEATKETDGSEEVSMAKSQLLKVVDMAKDLAAAMDDEDELEAWIQNKITTAYNELDDVHSYVEYGEDLQDEKHDVADKDTPMDESVIAEETENGEETAGMSDEEKKSLARLQALIRLGLLDRQSLPTISRAIKKLDTEMPINNIAEKMALFELLQSLISIITGDTSVFAKVRSSVIRK